MAPGPTEQLATLLPMLTHIVGHIRPDQFDLPTPCSNFTVREVIDHMIGGAEAFAPAFRGTATTNPGTDGGAHPSARFRAAMADLLDAVQSPGAMTRTVEAPFGTVSGEVFARFVAFDGLIHGWDLATSTSQAYDPPADIVGQVAAFAHQALVPEMRDGETFAEATVAPQGSGELAQLVAFSGRTVHRVSAA
jgi:uncharacterized protein (TIGR03086 family)